MSSSYDISFPYFSFILVHFLLSVLPCPQNINHSPVLLLSLVCFAGLPSALVFSRFGISWPNTLTKAAAVLITGSVQNNTGTLAPASGELSHLFTIFF